MNKKNNAALVLGFIVIIALVVLIFTSGNSTPAKPVALATPPMLNDDVFPLYEGPSTSASSPAGGQSEDILPSATSTLAPHLSWNVPTNATTTLNTVPLSGALTVSKPVVDVTNIATLASALKAYYGKKLAALGWSEVTSFEADGAGSSQWVYVKQTVNDAPLLDQYIIFSYKSAAVTQAADAPLSCPCDVTFSIFTGQVVE